jgi:hypothetical protein
LALQPSAPRPTQRSCIRSLTKSFAVPNSTIALSWLSAENGIQSRYSSFSPPQPFPYQGTVVDPAKAHEPGPLLLKQGDRLAIIGDSITEQKMYSRIIENYLTACVPDLNVTVRQYGWSGEKTEGFLRRMDKDCLTFEPTVATICYGINDARYRPFDITNGN